MVRARRFREDNDMPATGGSSAVLLWVVGLVIAGGVSYFTSKGTTDSRVTRVETQFEEMQRSLERIERSVEHTNSRLERMLMAPAAREPDLEPQPTVRERTSGIERGLMFGK